jgi:GTPase SAR1 family protein
VKVDKKQIIVDVEVFLWDVAGEVSQDKVPVSYFLGAHGIIYVFDLTRPLTYQNIISDISYLKKLAPKAIIKVVANKKDLVTPEQITQISNTLDVPYNIITSAKSGENVEDLFHDLAKEMFQNLTK